MIRQILYFFAIVIFAAGHAVIGCSTSTETGDGSDGDSDSDSDGDDDDDDDDDDNTNNNFTGTCLFTCVDSATACAEQEGRLMGGTCPNPTDACCNMNRPPSTGEDTGNNQPIDTGAPTQDTTPPVTPTDTVSTEGENGTDSEPPDGGNSNLDAGDADDMGDAKCQYECFASPVACIVAGGTSVDGEFCPDDGTCCDTSTCEYSCESSSVKCLAEGGVIVGDQTCAEDLVCCNRTGNDPDASVDNNATDTNLTDAGGALDGGGSL